jgi:hypothetical protein
MGDTRRRRLVVGWRTGEVAAELAADRMRFWALSGIALAGWAFLLPFGGAGEVGDLSQVFSMQAFLREPQPPFLGLSRQARQVS